MRINASGGFRWTVALPSLDAVKSAFSLLKRGIVGNFHKVSIKHLQRYLNEFTYRFNRRKDDGAFIENGAPFGGIQATAVCYFDF